MCLRSVCPRSCSWDRFFLATSAVSYVARIVDKEKARARFALFLFFFLGRHARILARPILPGTIFLIIVIITIIMIIT